MSLVVSDLGVKYQLQTLVTQYGADNLMLHLYQNNYTPTTSSILTDFTEATFDGYSSQTIATWSTPAVTAHVASSAAAALTFTKSAGSTPNQIYGYYVTDSAGTVVYWSERDPAGPVPMTATGNTYTVTIRDTQQSL